MAASTSNASSPPYRPTYDPSNSSKIVLLTGLNSYIGSHIVHLLLSLGYTVRGTSRRSDTLDRVLKEPAFSKYTPQQLQHVVVPDMTLPGAFDDAVRGVHAIIHVASPINFATTKTTDEFVVPAVKGVTSILQSALSENLNNGGGIKSFVLTSSVAAVVDRWLHPLPGEGGNEVYAYTEKDWNMNSERIARQSEIDAANGKGPFLAPVAYGGSKAAAERAFWSFNMERLEPLRQDPMKKQKAFACTSVNPGVVTGPPLLWPDSPSGLNETLLPVWKIWSGAAKKEGKLPPQIGGASFIDVRDVALLHVFAATRPDIAGGERYLANNGKAPPQAIADLIREMYKTENQVVERVIVGEPGKGYVMEVVTDETGARKEVFGWPADETSVKATKAYNALGVKSFRGFDESIRDTVEAFREKWPELGL